MITTWVLIIMMRTNGSYVPTSVTVPGYATRESCMASVEFVNKRSETLDAFCLARPEPRT